MALPSSGPLTLADIQTEFGGSNPIGLSEYYAGGAYVLAGTSGTYGAVPSSGAIGIRNFYGTSSALVLTINSTVTNYNVFTAAGSPSTSINVILNITSSGVVGGVGTTALTVGQFPTGSTITINNSGIIRGFGGAPGTSTTGGNGGDALNANYANQTVVINNLAGAYIQGGGGGGGKGGTGGGGQYTQQVNTGTPGGGDTYPVSCNEYCVIVGYGTFCTGQASPQCAIYSDDNGSVVKCYSCAYIQTVNTDGGAGGNGGIGQGYSQSSTSGSGGAAGGTNAGTGGTGGNGAVYGSNGSTGSTGSNGNRTNGSAGYAGGTAGRYLVKGSNSVTLNNSGTVAGGLA